GVWQLSSVSAPDLQSGEGGLKATRKTSRTKANWALAPEAMRALGAAALIAGALFFSQAASAQLTDPIQNIGVRPELLKDVGIDQKLNESIPLGLTFNDENGKPVELRQYFGGKPVILSLVYYNC